jgi:hypothetical protein
MHSRNVCVVCSQSDKRELFRLILKSTNTLNSCTFLKDQTQLRKLKISRPSVAPILQILASDFVIAYFAKWTVCCWVVSRNSVVRIGPLFQKFKCWGTQQCYIIPKPNLPFSEMANRVPRDSLQTLHVPWRSLILKCPTPARYTRKSIFINTRNNITVIPKWMFKKVSTSLCIDILQRFLYIC